MDRGVRETKERTRGKMDEDLEGSTEDAEFDKGHGKG